ncbi:MAG: alpha/beta hydrolase [Eubacteriales bacterium]|nr:alpha/beta hydrolase [Eubacteriales bacterium]
MDIQLFYVDEGSGFPIILLHGNGESSDYFVHQIDYFSGNYRVIAVDTRGHGRSPRGMAEFSIGQFAEDLKAFMDQLSIPRAVILGFSDGANIAMKFALKYQERVAALILNGGNLDSGGVKVSVQIPIEIGYRISGLFAGKSEEAKRHMELLGLMVKDPNIAAEELKGIRVPTLVIAGTKDMIREDHTRRIAEGIAESELKIIPGSHFVANKEPEAFNEAVNAFLNKLDL